MFTIEVEADSDGELLLEFPDELMDAVNWQPGDTITWIDNEDGTWTLTKEKVQTNLENLVKLIEQWHYDRNLIEGSTDKDQYLKLIQEAGELSDNICKGKDIRDDIGDMMVVLINIMARNNLSIEECLQVAYDDIKDRKGKMIDGVFVKESDLQ